MAQVPTDSATTLGTAWALRTIAGAFSFVLLTFVALVHADADPQRAWLVVVVAATLLFQPGDILDFWFQAQMRNAWGALAKSSAHLLTAGARVVLILAGATVIILASVYVLEAVLFALSLYLLYRIGIGPLRVHVSLAKARSLLYESWPLMISAVTTLIYMRMDQLLLSTLHGAEELGMYSAVVPFSEAPYTIAAIVVACVAPWIAKLRVQSVEHYKKAMQKLFTSMFIAALLLSTFLAVFADELVSWALGYDYAKSGSVLAIHALASVFVFLGMVQALWIVNERRPQVALAQTLCGAFTSVVLNLLLIPKYGAMGAASAYVIAQAATIVGNAYSAREVFHMQVNACLPWKWVHQLAA